MRRHYINLRPLFRSLFVKTEDTPNVNSLKFSTGHTVMKEGVKEFTEPKEAIMSPLADKLFRIEGVKTIFYGPDFITVSKDDRFRWEQLKPSIFAAIMDQYTFHGEELFKEAVKSGLQEWPSDASPETVAMICEILDTRIRPAVQQDGGDIEYRGFVKGYVKLKLQGACRSCSSSTLTLRNGIENMLMHYVPEVLGVEQIVDEADSVAEKEFEKFEGKYPRDEEEDQQDLINVIKPKPKS